MVEDLLPNDADHLEALLASNAIYDHVAVYADKVLAVEYRILILTSSVDHLRRKLLVFIADDLGECVLNGRVVCVDKVAVNVLNGEGALACTVDVSHKPWNGTACVNLPTDLLPTIAILRCFCCGAILGDGRDMLPHTLSLGLISV